MTDKELEKLFQKKFAGQKVEFNPEAWERMERMLDRKMPVVPWYITFSSWIKGLTAAMVVGFSSYFLVLQPYQMSQSDDINGVAPVVNTPVNNDNSEPPLDGSTEVNSNAINDGNANNASSSISSVEKTETTPPVSNSTNNSPQAAALAYNDGDGKKKRRKNKKNTIQTIPEERFSDTPANDINQKGNPPIDIAYVEQELDETEISKGQKAYKPNKVKKGSGASPMRFGFNFTAISAKNLLPETEGKLNTSMKPAFAIGMNLAQPISTNWGLSTGLNYKWQKASGYSYKEEINYSFGEEKIATALQYNALHSIELPLSVYWLKNKHQLSAGVYGTYLWAAQSDYVITTTRSFSTVVETGSYLSNNDLKDLWDFGATAGYSYLLNDKLELGLESWFGLTPLQYDANTDIKTNNFQLRLKFNYWLF